MDWNLIWFILIAVLFTGFFILEGFDYGVGMMMLFRSKEERTQFIKSIAPVWDANEVWLITAGGASFAAFPDFYATMFSTFYLALFLMLMALILRGVAFELRGKFKNSDWINFWDGAIIFGSFIPAFLWGVAMANLLQGLPINSQMHYTGNFLTLLNPFSIIGGLFFVSLFMFHGANFLRMKLADESLRYELKKDARAMGQAAWTSYLCFVITAVNNTDVMSYTSGVLIFASAMGVLSAGFPKMKEKDSPNFCFATSTVTIAMTVIGLFVALFPRLMVSSLNPEWSLTIYNAASTPYTLTIMTVAAVIFVPVVLIYQGWTYKIFKEKITPPARD